MVPIEYIIFVDGSFLETDKFASCAVLIFNNNNLVDKILFTNINRFKSSTEVELMALKIALKRICNMLKTISIRKILIFTDCKSIVDILKVQKRYKTFIKLNHNLYNYVCSTNNTLSNKEDIYFRIEYLPRKFNVAHKYCYELLKKYKN